MGNVIDVGMVQLCNRRIFLIFFDLLSDDQGLITSKTSTAQVPTTIDG